MKAILVIDMPTNCGDCPLIGVFGNNTSWRCVVLDKDIEDENDEYFITRPKWCPLKHPLKYVSNDFYIYDTKYLMENLDREIELLKGVKEFESNISD